MLFNEFRNDLFLTDVDKHKKEVFIGNDTVNLDNVYKTFIINFNDDKTFSIKDLYQVLQMNFYIEEVQVQ